MTIPVIGRMQFGIIDEVYMNTVSSAVDGFLDMKPQIEEVLASVSLLKSKPFFAIITKKSTSKTVDLTRYDGTTSYNTPVAWVYEWATVSVAYADENEVTWTASVPQTTSQDVMDSVDPDNPEIISGLAINLAEQGNQGTYATFGIIFGVNVKEDIYPTGFVPVGSEEGDIVCLQKTVSTDGAIIYFFDRQGTHDGACS